MSTDYPIVTISTQPIELCKLLKIANMVAGGGEAKIVISEGYVTLNGEVEFQKRKKVYENDIIEFNGDIVQVECVPANRASTNKVAETKKKVRHKKETNVTHTFETNDEAPVMRSPSKRRPISF